MNRPTTKKNVINAIGNFIFNRIKSHYKTINRKPIIYIGKHQYQFLKKTREKNTEQGRITYGLYHCIKCDKQREFAMSMTMTAIRETETKFETLKKTA